VSEDNAINRWKKNRKWLRVAAGQRCECGLGVWPRLIRRPCLWRTAPLWRYCSTIFVYRMLNVDHVQPSSSHEVPSEESALIPHSSRPYRYDSCSAWNRCNFCVVSVCFNVFLRVFSRRALRFSILFSISQLLELCI